MDGYVFDGKGKASPGCGMFSNTVLLDENSFHPTVIGDLTEEQIQKEIEKLTLVMEINAVIDAVKGARKS